MKRDGQANAPDREVSGRAEAALVEALAERVYRQLQSELRLEIARGARTRGPAIAGGAR